MQAFLNAGGGDAGGVTVSVTAPLTMPTKSKLFNCTIVGYSCPVVLIAGDGVTPITGVHIADVTLESGGVKLNLCGDSFVERVRVKDNVTVGIEVTRGYEVRVTDCSVKNGTGIGILVDGVGNDQYLTRCRVVGVAVGVELRQTGAVWLDTVGTSFCGTGLVAGYGPQQVEFVFSTRCAYDEGAGYGMKFGPMVRSVESAQDWASSNGYSGVIVDGAASVSLSQLRCFNNGWHGVHFNAGSDLELQNAVCSGNGGASAPNYHGITLGNVNGARVIGCRSGVTGPFANLQGYGLFMAGMSAVRVLIDACDFTSNMTGGTFLQGNYKQGINYP